MTPHRDPLRHGTGPLWLQAMTLPTLPWARPFLDQMGFPKALLPHVDTLADIAEATHKERDRLWNKYKAEEYSPERDAAINREFVGEALNKLADAVGADAADSFRIWAIDNFVDETAHGALLAWRVILRSAMGQGSSGDRLPPDALARALPQVIDLLRFEDRQQLHDRLLQTAPPYEDDTGMGDDLSPEAMTIEEIIISERTRAALRRLGEILSPAEQAEALQWAEKQADAQGMSSGILRGTSFWQPQSG